MAVFLFGEQPDPPTSLLKPGGIAMCGRDIIICDGPQQTLFRYRCDGRQMDEIHLSERPKMPAAACIARNGDLLVADAAARAVLRYNAAGDVVARFSIPGPFKPSGIACVDGEVWVSNVASHCIEVFDEASAKLIRTIGSRGEGHAQFCYPMGMAVTPAGDVCVVDMVNHRVQLLNRRGEWLRDIGKAGDCVGCLGRPKHVAVGPDGTIFVTDATCGRVHAFDAQGRPLLAFGEPDAGAGALLMPCGICISKEAPAGHALLPEEFEPSYFILVAEQMLDPGIRVYAWRSPTSGARAGAASAKPALHIAGQLANVGPHWSPQNCGACHQMQGQAPQPIPVEKVDALCLSCHDGVKGRAEAHPIGRLAQTAAVKTPADWPIIDQRISCLTCHDVRRHCESSARRPAINSAMVRGFDSDRPAEYCHTCHKIDSSWRFSPHDQIAADGTVKEQSCLFCHEQAPQRPADGVRHFEPHLRGAGSRVCLNCHPRHWDVSPQGHVDRPVTDAVRRRLLAREFADHTDGADGKAERRRSDAKRQPRRLPITDGRVTCYSCHNPHQRGLFAESTELGQWADTPEDAAVALRVDRMQLCMECHRK